MPIPALGPHNPFLTTLPPDYGAGGDPNPAPTAPGAAPAPVPAPAPEAPPTVDGPRGETASLNLDHLAKAIGLDPDEVLRRISNGEGLGSRLSQAGETGYGSTVRGMLRGGIVVDEYA